MSQPPHRRRLSPRSALAALWLLTPLLPGCPGDDDDDDTIVDDDIGDDDSAADDDDDLGDDDTSWGDPGAQPPPALDPLPPHTNAAVAELTGAADVGGSTIRVYASHLSPPLELAADGDGLFGAVVPLALGQPSELYVTATADALESEPATATVERCTPGDPFEVLGGDSCEDAIDLGSLFDDGTLRSLSGNALEAGDEDWYQLLAADDYLDDLSVSGDAWHVRMWFTVNDDDAFRMTVFKGSCADAVCDDPAGYTEFSDTVEQTPCGGVNNVCADDTAPFWVRITGDPAGSGCAGYTLSLTNG